MSWKKRLLFPWYVLKVLYLIAKYPQVREAVKRLEDEPKRGEL